MYASVDGADVPVVAEELKGSMGSRLTVQPRTLRFTGAAYSHSTGRMKMANPVREHESTTYASSLKSIDDFGPLLRQEAVRRGTGSASSVVLLIDESAGLENLGRLCF